MLPSLLVVWLAALAAAAHIAQPFGARSLAERAAAAGADALSGRALPNSPSGHYAPQKVDCPSTRPTIRRATGLSKEETDWLSRRRPATVKPMTDFLTRAGISGFDAAGYMSKVSSNVKNMPNIGIAISGGGYRALMNGGGFLMAADDRTPGSTDKGGIGGLLQSSTYLAGLSGGSWLISSIMVNNFSTVVNLRDGGLVWRFDRSILQGPDQSSNIISATFRAATYWTDLLSQVDDKKDAGFDTSLTDYWGRMLAYQLIGAAEGGPAYTFSSISQDEQFKNGSTPFPIVVADGRAPGTWVISLNSTVFEFNPFELGSWDPTEYGFAPLEYVGSDFKAGAVPADGKCVRGFDSASFVFGTSSSLFNMVIATDLDTAAPDAPSAFKDVVRSIAEDVGEDNNDVASYKPNPFYGFNNGTAGSIATAETLSLVDGGEDLQNIPLHPLIQPVRAVDVVFAVDNSADTEHSWPNGTALRASYDRSRSKMANGTLFPPVPDANTFINKGLNNRPTFFGCDVSNFTLSAGASAPPLIVYLPNAPYTTLSNMSTFTMTYPTSQRNDVLVNGYNAGTQGNATLDADWPACVACAVLHRSLVRTGTSIPSQCTSCFSRYCWDGSLNSTAPAGPYEPAFKIKDETTARSAAASLRGGGSGPLMGLSLAVVAAVAALL